MMVAEFPTNRVSKKVLFPSLLVLNSIGAPLKLNLALKSLTVCSYTPD